MSYVIGSGTLSSWGPDTRGFQGPSHPQCQWGPSDWRTDERRTDGRGRGAAANVLSFRPVHLTILKTIIFFRFKKFFYPPNRSRFLFSSFSLGEIIHLYLYRFVPEVRFASIIFRYSFAVCILFGMPLNTNNIHSTTDSHHSQSGSHFIIFFLSTFSFCSSFALIFFTEVSFPGYSTFLEDRKTYFQFYTLCFSKFSFDISPNFFKET